MDKVKVISMTNGLVSVKVPTASFHREWLNRGAAVMIEKDKLEELMYDTGFKYMIDTGILYIEDLETKKELGIEPEDATEPVNVIVLSEEDKTRLMTTMTLKEFKAKVETLTKEQLDILIDFAVENHYADFDKAKILQKLTGRDIIQTIRLSDQNKEV